MIRNENRLLGALVMNVLVVLFEMHSLFVSLFIKSNFTLSYFGYYTHISGTLALLSSLLIVVELSREMSNSLRRTRYAFRKLRYVSVCMQTMTMLVVFLVILPSDLMKNSFSLYRYANVGEYAVCPILSLISMIVFGDYRGVTKRDAFIAFIPTFVYGCVAGLLNALGVIDGPYDFVRARTLGVGWSVFWFVVMNGSAYTVARLLIVLSRRFNQKYVSETE